MRVQGMAGVRHLLGAVRELDRREQRLLAPVPAVGLPLTVRGTHSLAQAPVHLLALGTR